MCLAMMVGDIAATRVASQQWQVALQLASLLGNDGGWRWILHQYLPAMVGGIAVRVAAW